MRDPRNGDERVAYLLLFAMAAMFGGTWVAGRWAVDELPVFVVAELRFGSAAILLAAWVALSRRRLSAVRRADLPLVAGLGLTGVAGYNWLFLTGLTLAPSSDGSILVPGTIPILTMILAVILLAERIGRRAVLGMAVAIAGLLVVIGPGSQVGGARLTGDLIFLGSAGFWASYNILVKLAGHRFDAVSATLYAMVAGAVFLLPLALLQVRLVDLEAASLRAWGSIAYLTVFGSILPFLFLQIGVARIGAARASAFTLLVPLFGVALSVFVLNERPTPLIFVGGVVVLAGLWLVQTDRATTPAPEPMG
ncbi:MAG TPA: DMT family transporter [Candidatus Limnocylindria bacterium]|nr:DMT family transporter [Candidatus Limnocylindria bacterium]